MLLPPSQLIRSQKMAPLNSTLPLHFPSEGFSRSFFPFFRIPTVRSKVLPADRCLRPNDNEFGKNKLKKAGKESSTLLHEKVGNWNKRMGWEGGWCLFVWQE